MLDRTVPPPFIKSVSFQLPPFQKLSVNAVPVFLVPEVKQDVLKIELMFDAGKWFEPAAGVSHFTSNMLEKGTKRLNSSELAAAFDGLGAHVEVTAGYDHTSVSLYALQKNWKEAANLLVEMLNEPSFDQEELDLMRGIFIQNLKINKEKTSFLVGQLIRKNLYGNHPYGTSLEEKDVVQVTTEQLRDYHKKAFTPKAIFATVPSSVSFTELSSILGNLTTSTPLKAEQRVVSTGRTTEHVDKAGVQTSIRLGKRTVLRSDKRYPEFLLFSHILGGFFGSRLMKNIREEKGLTYGIYASINPFQNDSFFVIGADVNKENRQLALDEISKEIKRLRTERIEEEELEIARNHFLGSLQSEVANPFSVTDKIKNIHLNSLPPDYYPRLFARINEVTAEELIQTGNDLLQEDSLSVASVG